jgi:signal peptidase II
VSGGPRKLPFLLLSLVVLVLDQGSKAWIERHLAPHAVLPVIDGFLNLTHVRNTGVAFGWFAGPAAGIGSGLLSMLGFVALAVVAVYFRRASPGDRLLLAALALILGGAVGNLLDRLASGAVTDFIDCYLGTHHWHTFNVADSAITVGIGLMALDFLRRREPAAARQAP